MSTASRSIKLSDLQQIADNGYVVVEDFLSASLCDELRKDVFALRDMHRFHKARIGDDGMVQDENQPYRDIRYSETCFIGRLADEDLPKDTGARHQLYDLLANVKEELHTNTIVREGLRTKSVPPLDQETEELMYAYYPQGGYYRRHRDAEPGSLSNWRKYSFLVYLNEADWTTQDGGQLRIHRDSGGDHLPHGELPNFVDVHPKAGTLVVFRSDQCPHEVLETRRERIAVVGWLLSKDQSQQESPNTEAPASAVSRPDHIDPQVLTHLRALRDANPRLKTRLEPPPPPPSVPSIFGDDFVLPGATSTSVVSPTEEKFPDTDMRYWKKIATFDTEGHVNTLSLGGIRMAQVVELVPPLLDRVVTLDMASTNVSADELATVLTSIKSDTELQQLRLGGNPMDHAGLEKILQASASFLFKLFTLDLRYNDMGPAGASVLAAALNGPDKSCIKALYLEGNKLGDKGASAISTIEGLQDVYVGQNEIGPEGAASLAATASRSWKKLFVEGNKIGNDGAHSFMTALVSAANENTKTLERLYSDNNGMTKDVYLKLGQAVGSPTLIASGGLFQ